MSDWAQRIVDGMRDRQAARERAAEARAVEVDAELAAEEPAADRRRRLGEERDRAESARAERLADHMREQREARARAARPLSAYDRQMVGQALGPEWDDGPDAA
ncbi:hypothetical protein [Streptomyces sp. NPDC101455]|uniref:hypothetical protein n=1 Tax=Streptomyces sp. NPDC101455 TaxID=3366142 RepID=UPI0037FCD050